MDQPQQNYTQYQQFEGIWRAIDDNNMRKLEHHRDLLNDINEKQQGYTPLHLACLKKRAPLMAFLLQNGADPNVLSRGRSPLYLATIFGDFDMCLLLLEHGANPNLISKDACNLHVAAARGLTEITELLIKFGADVNVSTPKAGTPCHVAVSRDHRQILTLLLKHDPDLNVLNSQGETVLHIASRLGHTTIIDKFLEYQKQKIDPMVRDGAEGNTALHLAAMYNHEQVTKTLAKNFPEALVALNESERRTPLFYMNSNLRRSMRDSMASKKDNCFVRLFGTVPELAEVVFVARDFGKGEEELKPVGDLMKFPAHASVVYARCEALFKLATPELELQPLIAANQKEQPKRRSSNIYIEEFGFPVVRSFVYFLYTDSIQCKQKYWPMLMEMANKFGVHRLAKQLESDMGASIQVPLSTWKRDMAKLLKSKAFADVLIRVTEESEEDDAKPTQVTEFYVHSDVLNVASAYFKTMFGSTLTEASSKIIQVQQSSAAVISYTLRDIYGADLPLQRMTTHQWVEILDVATRFMLDGLGIQSQNNLALHVDDVNVCGLYHSADIFQSVLDNLSGSHKAYPLFLSAQLLKEECIDYLLQAVHVRRTAEWTALPDALKNAVTEYGRLIAKKPKLLPVGSIANATPQATEIPTM